MAERPQLVRFWPIVGIFLAYMGLAILVTWPLSAKLSTHLPSGTDTLVHYWNNWWIEYALKNGQSPDVTPMLFYPHGISLAYHNMSWVHALPSLLLTPVVGRIAAYNLVYLAYLGLCGFACFLLTLELAGNRRVAFLAGLIYQCWPSRLTHASHPGRMSTWPVPLLILFLSHGIHQGQWVYGLGAGACLLLIGYINVQLLLPVAIIATIYVLLTLPGHLNRRSVAVLFITAVMFAIGIAPKAVMMLHEWRTNPTELILESEEITMQTDLLAYLTPPRLHSVFGRVTESAYARYYPDRGSRRDFSPYIGFVALGLAIVGTIKAGWRRALPWIISAIILIWLALGPILRVNGQFYPRAPMLYALAARFFVVRLMREPDRFNIFLALPISLLAAYGMSHILRRIPENRRRWKTAGLCLSGMLILFEYLLLPFSLQSGQLSSFYDQLAPQRAAAPQVAAQAAASFAVLNIPVNPAKSKPYMLAQTVHGHPILQGHSSRYPQGTFDYLDSQPWLREMRRYDLSPPKQRDISRQLEALARDNIRYLIVHKDMLGDPYTAKWKRYLIIDPLFEDEQIAVYSTTPQSGKDFTWPSELAPGIGAIHAYLSANCLTPGLPLQVDVAWGTTESLNRDLIARVTIAMADKGNVLSMDFPIVADWPTFSWPAGTVVWGSYVLNTDALSEEDYDVVLTLVDAQSQVSYETLTIGQVRVAHTCPLPPLPDGATEVNVRFGDAMHLIGYQSSQDQNNLDLTLYWRSIRQMKTDYKIFVHVFDPATGIPVAQDDAMPLRWRYPTTLWDAGEKVVDVISIPLDAVKPGNYGIAVGIYDPATMDRLLVTDKEGERPDGRWVLSDQLTVN